MTGYVDDLVKRANKLNSADYVNNPKKSNVLNDIVELVERMTANAIKKGNETWIFTPNMIYDSFQIPNEPEVNNPKDFADDIWRHSLALPNVRNHFKRICYFTPAPKRGEYRLATPVELASKEIIHDCKITSNQSDAYQAFLLELNEGKLVYNLD